MSDPAARGVLAAACVVALLGIACPKPAPIPARPDASDAAAAVDARAASCEVACAHLVAISCPVKRSVCLAACERIHAKAAAYPGCLVAAKSCAAADACDPVK